MFSSLYPSIMNEFNIATNTQIGRIEIPHKVYPHENSYQINGYVRSGEFIENLTTDNIVEFFKRWFNLGGIVDVIKDINEYFSEYGLGNFNDIINDYNSPFDIMDKSYYYEPVVFDVEENGTLYCPVTFNNLRDRESQSYNSILQGRNYSR